MVWRLDATAYNCDGQPLIDGLNCTIDGPIKYDGDPVSACTLEYAQGLARGTFRRFAKWHGSPTRTSVRESPSLYLRRAQQRYGTQERIESTDLVYADRTADRTLAWWAQSGCEPWRVLRVVSDGLHHRAHVASLEPGMSVPVTSDRYSLSSRVAHVTRAGRLGAVAYADLVILSAP